MAGPLTQLRRSLRRWRADFQSRYRHDFIFIHINKTGGSSIEHALGMRFDHRTARDKREALGDEVWQRKFKFTVVRNPWDKVASHYHYRRDTRQAGFQGEPPSFRDWVVAAYEQHDPKYFDQPLMFAPQMDWIADSQDVVLVDFIGRFERLSDDFELIRERIGVQTSLPHLKPSKRGDYRQYYDERTRDIVAKVFARDIQHLDYRFD